MPTTWSWSQVFMIATGIVLAGFVIGLVVKRA